VTLAGLALALAARGVLPFQVCSTARTGLFGAMRAAGLRRLALDRRGAE